MAKKFLRWHELMMDNEDHRTIKNWFEARYGYERAPVMFNERAELEDRISARVDNIIARCGCTVA